MSILPQVGFGQRAYARFADKGGRWITLEWVPYSLQFDDMKEYRAYRYAGPCVQARWGRRVFYFRLCWHHGLQAETWRV